MPATCVITGYKLGVSSIIVYGFIISGTVFQPPSPSPTVFNNTTTVQPETTDSSSIIQTTPETTTPDHGEHAECGVPPVKASARSLESPIARLLAAIFTKRILGGTDTIEGDWPWMVYLFERPRGRERGFICGGALVDQQWVVTAAHCISQPNSPDFYGIVLGEHSSSNVSIHEREMSVETIVRHRQFSGATFNNDIALIKLTEAIRFTRYIRPVCLVPTGFPTDSTESVVFEDNKFTFAGKVCTALGWGKTANEEKTDIMQQVNVIILPHLLCSSATRNPSSKPYSDRPVNENDPKFCAGGTVGEDTCAGDSGGPLLCIHKGKYYLHGITSYGTTPCGQRNLPGVYTRASDYYEWIMENMK